jgi:hypothetical protein
VWWRSRFAKQGIDLKIDVVGFRVGGKARTSCSASLEKAR